MSYLPGKRCTRRAGRFLPGVWLGLLAIALHAIGPLLGPALTGAHLTPASHTHDSAAHSHHHGVPGTVAEHPPAPPDLVCVGDCPCCSLGDRPLPLVNRWPVILLPADRKAGWWYAALAPPHVFHPGTHFLPRAPPVFV